MSEKRFPLCMTDKEIRKVSYGRLHGWRVIDNDNGTYSVGRDTGDEMMIHGHLTSEGIQEDLYHNVDAASEFLKSRYSTRINIEVVARSILDTAAEGEIDKIIKGLSDL